MNKQVKFVCPLGATCQTETEEVITRCHWYVKLQGNDPQTGESRDEWGCAMSWMPILQIEGSQQMRQAGAAIESFRNEMVKGNQVLLSGFSEQVLMGKDCASNSD